MSELGEATSTKLLDLFNMMKNGTLKLRPFFQRKLVWNDNHKEKFIDTILMKLPFPEIYLADGEIDLTLQTLIRLVVDGQQRLSTIYQYITGSADFTIKNIRPFVKLSATEQTDFYNYKIIVRDLGKIDDDKIREIFKRINSVQYALNAVEIQNALYEGEYISTAKEIVENDKSVGVLFDVFNEAEFTRMKDIEFILLIMSTIEENGYFSLNSEIEKYIIKYDPQYPNKDWMKINIENVFKLILECGLTPDSIWFRKSSFYSLIVELLKFQKGKGFLPNSKSLANMLINLENKVLVSKTLDITQDRYAEYYHYTFQGTSGKTGRLVRGKLIMEYLNSLK